MRNNIAIASEIKQELLSHKELEMSIRSSARGSFEVFIRDFHCQKIKFQMLEIDSKSYDHFTDDDNDDDEIELPSQVYRRFCLLLSELIKELAYPLEYGHLICSWEFEESEDGEDWKDYCKAVFIKEHHLKHLAPAGKN